MAALRKALMSLFSDQVPDEAEVLDVARKIFQEVCDATPGGNDDEITKSDLYNYIVNKSEVCMGWCRMGSLPNALPSSALNASSF